ncbi:MAG: carboxymuconolactone decarboxylase family protein [Acinetobacter sp.]|uniref:carboxymuconolactone decarboxylase family protein n=1 Tax=Acinetobacter sp. TaxID=472 RepID=UPI0026DFBA07|nr:carboxymuconolactone decarboxylase family protein [Acinetobacter sp.]MDO5541681.1 carboxymuconolactone decarboxylase family protein [Acinetobacter sp.]
MKYTELTAEISSNIKSIKERSPDLLKSFNTLSQVAMKDGVIDAKTKEFIALAIGVAQRCDGCIGFHVRTLVKMGMTFEELNEILGIAVYMGGGPSLMYAANAVAAFKEFSPSIAE